MLIKCPECGKPNVSDKAQACPECGFPFMVAPVQLPKKNESRKYRKLPNKFGTIKKLSGKRRKPFAAYPPVDSYHDNGSPVSVPALGYFETWHEAYDKLAEYNKNPYDIENLNITFAECYEMFYKDKFELSKREYSASAKSSSKAGFKNLSALHDIPIRKLRKRDFQHAIDSCKLKHASLELMIQCAKDVSGFALENDIIQKDYSQFLTINIPDDDELGVPYTLEELDVLWAHSNERAFQIALILIYTGMRIGELKTISIDWDNKTISGGLKTTAGRNRIIPIHPFIECFLKNFSKEKLAIDYLRKQFDAKSTKYGIMTSIEGTKHTFHDCRHTFSFLADKDDVKMDEVAKHLIMGHSLGSDVEKKVYSYRDVERLRSEVLKITYKGTKKEALD